MSHFILGTLLRNEPNQALKPTPRGSAALHGLVCARRGLARRYPIPMETLPFNACDYRCERCLETEQCAVFRMGAELDERSFALGRETEGIEALRDVQIFAATRSR